MISKNEYQKLYHKARLLDRIKDGKSMSLNRLHMGASMAYTIASIMVEEMEEDGMVESKLIARAKRILITKKGREYLKRFDEFLNIIETLNKEYGEQNL